MREIVIGLPELTDEQIVELVQIGEEAARKHVLSRLPAKKVYDLDVSVDVEGDDPLTVTVDVGLRLSSSVRIDPEVLAREAAEKAMKAIENKLRELALAGKEA